MPFISIVLGYDVFNPSEVIPEFTADVSIKKGEKINDPLRIERVAALSLLRGDERPDRHSHQR